MLTVLDDSAVQGQQGFANCTGGQGTLPNEQKTQQCPGSGRSNAPQETHGWKYTQASVGMISSRLAPQRGQVSVERSTREDALFMRCGLDGTASGMRVVPSRRSA